jgi:hypothetical protein
MSVISEARAARKARHEAETAKDKNANIGDTIAKGALGAGLAYLSGGILPALLPGGASVAAAGPVTAAGVGATTNIGIPAAIGANLMNPSSSAVLNAIQGGIKGMEAKDTTGSAIEGLKAGTEPTVMEGLGLSPSTGKRGEIDYSRAGLSLDDLRKINIPGLEPNYTIGKGGATVQLKKPTATKPPASKTPPAMSLGRLSTAGAAAYSKAQTLISAGKTVSEVSQAVNAENIPAGEKAIIINKLKTPAKASTDRKV